MTGSCREEITGNESRRNNMASLRPALGHLDRRLEEAMAGLAASGVPAPGADLYRGLYVGREDVVRLLAREPGASPWISSPVELSTSLPEDDNPGLEWLARDFELSAFDLDLVIIALAPEIDLRYERIYAYLQDDVTRRRPGVELALNLLCDNAEEKVVRRSHFAADAPLVANGLLHLHSDSARPRSPLLSYELAAWLGWIVGLLLGRRWPPDQPAGTPLCPTGGAPGSGSTTCRLLPRPAERLQLSGGAAYVWWSAAKTVFPRTTRCGRPARSGGAREWDGSESAGGRPPPRPQF